MRNVLSRMLNTEKASRTRYWAWKVSVLKPGMTIGSWLSADEKHSTSESPESEEPRNAPRAMTKQVSLCAIVSARKVARTKPQYTSQTQAPELNPRGDGVTVSPETETEANVEIA